jgi:hypothetical protein
MKQRFLLDGHQLRTDDTPDDLNMEDGAVIDAMESQPPMPRLPAAAASVAPAPRLQDQGSKREPEVSEKISITVRQATSSRSGTVRVCVQWLTSVFVTQVESQDGSTAEFILKRTTQFRQVFEVRPLPAVLIALLHPSAGRHLTLLVGLAADVL